MKPGPGELAFILRLEYVHSPAQAICLPKKQQADVSHEFDLFQFLLLLFS